MTTATSVDIAVSQVRQAAFEISVTDEQQASRMIREALKLQPGHADLLGDLAALHLQAGRYDQCIQAAREALTADPANDESAYALALALEGTGRFAEARTVYEDLSTGSRAQRFAAQQPELAALCRGKLTQLQQLPARLDIRTAAPAERVAPAVHSGPYAPKLIRPDGLGHLLSETTGIQALTLDCFDTILWRHTDKPTDVFYDMQQRPAFRAAGIDGVLRATAERYARQLQSVRTGRTEVNLDQIYLAARPDLGPDLLRWLAEDELAAEMQACHAHPGAVRLLRDAKARQLPVTIVSDTYLSAAQLRRLLAHCLPADAMAAIGDIICSSEHGVSKGQGLFKLARLNLSTNAPAVLHVGDNKDADVRAPMALGMSATHLLQELEGATLRRGMAASALSLLDPSVRSARPLHMPYRPVHATYGTDVSAPHTAIGHAALGPLMHAFARWIDEEATALSATRSQVKLVFLMRDAYLPLETLRAIDDTTPTYAAHISRFSAYAASFRRLEHVDHYLATFAQNVTMEMIARQLMLSPERAAQLMEQAESTTQPRQTFIALIRQPGVLAEIFEASAVYRERLRRYLERETDLKRGDTMVLVDLGYAGTIQRVLGPVIEEEWGVEVFGRYLLMVGMSNERRRALIDRSWLDDRALATLQPYVGLLETLAAEQSGSVVGYDDDGQAIFEDKQIDDAQRDAVFRIQQECLRFAREAEGYFGAAHRMPSSTILRDEALGAFGRMLFFPSEQELRHLGEFQLEINLGSGMTRRLFDVEAGLDGLRRHGLFYVSQVKDDKDLRMTIPAELRAAGMELSLSLLAQHRFGLDLYRSEWSVRKSPVHVLVTRGTKSVQVVVDASPTHDGYFSALVPISGDSADIALALGRTYRWIQIHSVELVPLASGREAGEVDLDVWSSFVPSGIQEHGGGLLECTAPDALLMLPADALPEHGRAALRLVFRPIAVVDAH